MEIVFAQTEWRYTSYTDYKKLVELSGFKTCLVKEIDFSKPAVYIISPANGELVPAIEAQRSRNIKKACKLVVWWLERPDCAKTEPANRPKQGLLEQVDEFYSLVDEVWVSDRYLASLDARLKHVILGSHPGLREGFSVPPVYDFCHMSYVYGRRGDVFYPIAKNWKVGKNGWGKERSDVLNSSRAILNVHQTPIPIGEPLRFALAAAYKLPLITETLKDPWPLVKDFHFFSADASELGQTVKDALGKNDLARFGDRLHALLCEENTFEKHVRKAALE